ncbi:MAG: ABC transporter ATP-binding protein [Gammaproteobacteria bacterium]|nr:ABC transporter ATP-binding protein [Gammaproteobacteria bacterium]
MTELSTQQLSLSIAGKLICQQLELQFKPAQIWGVLGRNGVGKTTLLHTLAGLRDADSGQIFIAENNLNELTRKQVAQKMGLLLQHVEDPFPSSVLETVLTGRHPHIPAMQWESAEDYELAEQALLTVDMQKLKHRSVNQLSGGERQRVAIATLITQNPEIFLLDEPNSHLDLHHQSRLLNWLCDFAQQQHRVLLMSLHDINLAARYCDHILLLFGDGEYLAGPRDKMLTETNLEKVFCHPIRQHSFNQQTIYIPD